MKRLALGIATLALVAAHPPCSMKGAKHQRAERMLAETMWGEGRNGGYESMMAVGHVIINRAVAHKPKLFGRGIRGVVMKKWQFTCRHKGDPNYAKITRGLDHLKHHTADEVAWIIAKGGAHMLVDHGVPDPTHGATYYYAASMKHPPKWAAKMRHVANYGGQRFYVPIPAHKHR